MTNTFLSFSFFVSFFPPSLLFLVSISFSVYIALNGRLINENELDKLFN